jgi:hypothetical protein
VYRPAVLFSSVRLDRLRDQVELVRLLVDPLAALLAVAPCIRRVRSPAALRQALVVVPASDSVLGLVDLVPASVVRVLEHLA